MLQKMVILISDQILRVSGSRGHIHTQKTICYLFKPFLDKNILLFGGGGEYCSFQRNRNVI